MKRNEMERNEMKICSLRNENPLENADFKFSVNNGAEGTSLSTAKATPTTRDRGIGDWNQGHCDRFTLSKPRFVSLPVSPPIYRSKSAKFQLCITARRIIIFGRTVPGHICSLFFSFSKSGRRNNAKSAFQYTVNNNTT